MERRIDESHRFAQESQQFLRRLKLLGLGACVLLGLLTARFVWLQFVERDVYQAKAEVNRVAAGKAEAAPSPHGK
ncbi:hypothetical protein HSX11_24865 [Oxalobacteraceae bacterium]|nr:hypothetical protein [Oxalobacteraceae bacterium]